MEKQVPKELPKQFSLTEDIERLINVLVELNSRLKKVDDFEKELRDLRTLVVNNY